MKQLILLVGIPGSGKSTLAKKLTSRGFHCLNADTIRQALYGDAAEQGEPQKVFSLFFKELEEALAKGLDIVIDNTNLNPKQRKPILDRAANCGYTDIQLWLLDVPLETCLERNRGRERTVSEDIVANMYMELNRAGRPRREEGRLVLIRPGKDENDYRLFPQN
ncbi:MAG: ATP-binding protein [Candidatus Melainabacteria bacterium]|nr:ATP-binding protein [Candidatus Melainabacteria bacterium]